MGRPANDGVAVGSNLGKAGRPGLAPAGGGGHDTGLLPFVVTVEIGEFPFAGSTLPPCTCRNPKILPPCATPPETALPVGPLLCAAGEEEEGTLLALGVVGSGVVGVPATGPPGGITDADDDEEDELLLLFEGSPPPVVIARGLANQLAIPGIAVATPASTE